MSDPGKTLIGAARQAQDDPEPVPEAAATEPAPVLAAPLAPLPESIAASAALAALVSQKARSCHLCGASEHEQLLKVMNGTPGLVRCAYVGPCVERYGARRAVTHEPGAGTAGDGPTPPVPGPVPPTSPGAGVSNPPPAAPAPGKTAATETGASQ